MLGTLTNPEYDGTFSGRSIMLLSVLFAITVSSSQALPAAGTDTKNQDKTICNLQHEVQSRIPVRVCMKQSEWERMAREAQEDMRKSTNQRHIPPN